MTIHALLHTSKDIHALSHTSKDIHALLHTSKDIHALSHTPKDDLRVNGPKIHAAQIDADTPTHNTERHRHTNKCRDANSQH